MDGLEEMPTLESGESDVIRERVVTIRYNGEDVSVTVPPEESILSAALEAGIDLPFACQMGICGMCRCRLASGRVHMDDQEALSEGEIAGGDALTCVAHPLSDDVVIDYD